MVNTPEQKQLRRQRVYFGSQFKVQPVPLGGREVKAAGADSIHNENDRVMNACCCSDLSISVVQDPNQEMVPYTVVTSFYLYTVYIIHHRHSQRLVSQVSQDTVKLTININHYRFIPRSGRAGLMAVLFFILRNCYTDFLSDCSSLRF